jgi:glycosyltransferase involved in cell wall biosynthesis
LTTQNKALVGNLGIQLSNKLTFFLYFTVHMKLSVIIPFYRELDLIRRSVDSVFKNTESIDEIEILICNDGPIPEADVFARLDTVCHPSTRVIKNIGVKGPGGARNTGLNLSSGEVIAFLDADDYWLPGKIAAQVDALKGGATFIATSYSFENSDVHITPPACITHPLDIFIKRGIGTSTVLMTRELLQSYRFRDIRFAQDIDFWYALSQSPLFKYSRVTRSSVVYSTGGSTRNKFAQLKYLYRVLELNSIPLLPRSRILFSYAAVGAFNHFIKRRIASVKK